MYLQNFSPSGRQQTGWQYSDGNPLTGVSNVGGWVRQKSRFWASAYIWLYRCVLSKLQPARCYQHGGAVPRSRKLWHIASSKRRSLLLAGDDNEMLMTKSLNVTTKTTEQHLLARSDKYVAYVTNNKRLCSTFCTVEANYWQTRSIARPLCDSRATCVILLL